MSQSINKEWMNEVCRLNPIYTNGVKEFIKFAIENDTLKLQTILCPCSKCKNKLRHPSSVVERHLVMNGFTRNYTKWLLHGESSNVDYVDKTPQWLLCFYDLLASFVYYADQTLLFLGLKEKRMASNESHDVNQSSSLNRVETGKNKTIAAKKKLIILNDGSVVGENSQKWSSRTGDFIRALIPVCYFQWGDVPKNFKDDVWKNLMDKFELDIPESVARPLLCKNWAQKFRSHKKQLRDYLKNGGDETPGGIDPHIWEKFVEMEKDPKKQKQCVDGSLNRNKNPISHSLGRCSYGQKAYKMEQADPKSTYDTRTERWLLGHENENGECAKPANKECYDKVKDALLKRKNSDVNSSTMIENDPVAEVLGRDKKGRVRGMGSHVDRKQLAYIGIAQAKEGLKKKEEAELVDEVMKEHIEVCVKKAFEGVVSSFNDVVADLKNSLGKGSPNLVSTPVSDFASNSVYPPVVRANLDNIVTKDPVVGPFVPIRKRTVDNPKVTLLNEVGAAVAKGFLVTESHKGICHGKQVPPGLKKVYVEEVLEPDARIFCPQSGMDTLAAYVEGGYLIWMESWLRMDE